MSAILLSSVLFLSSTDTDLELTSIPVNIGSGCSVSLKPVPNELSASAPSNISLYSMRAP